MSTNGNGNTVAGMIKAFLVSPVGGWALAVALVGFMAYLTFKDRQMMYEDLMRLRESVMPIVRESHDMLKDIYVEVMKKEP